MINQLRIENFKGFEECDMQLGPVTVLIGPNGNGKSSTFQALALLKQSLNSSDLNPSGPIVWGSFEELVHHGVDVDRQVPDPVGFQLTIPVDLPMPFAGRGTFVYKARFNGRQHAAIQISILNIDRETLFEAALGFDEQSAQKGLSIRQFGLEIDMRAGPLHQPFLVGSTRGEVPPGTTQSWEAFSRIVSETLGNVYLVPALRGFEGRDYMQLDDPPRDKDIAAAGRLEERSSKVLSVLLHRPDIEQTVSGWLDTVTERTAHREGLQGRRWFARTSDEYGRHFNVIHDGSGTNQLIHLFTQVALAPPGATICVDEPEIHLHPRAQARLSSLIVDIARQQRKQFLLATHSEYTVMAMSTAVAEQRLSNSDFRLYYFADSEGVNVCEPLDVNDRGQIAGGLKGFFEVEAEQTERFLEALSRPPRS